MSREYKNDGRDQFNVENARDIHIGEQRSRKRPDRELKWLRAFEKEIAGRLTTSLHNQILINLGKEIELDQVRRLWDMEVKSGQITEAIAPETEILDVFDRADIQGKLLILGKPGSGKTTTLLELARSLVKKALDDPSAPMPILLNLSSWKDPRQSLKDWTIAELTTKGIGSKISAKWLEDQKFLPLLDGLDEVRSDLQPACVKAINQFLSGEGKPEAIVVCSRREEYELYSEKLDLNGAIYLQELSDAQIETYLGKVDRLSLWEVLGADADLLELVRQPLLLSITLIAYRKELAERWQALQTTQARLEFLLDAYIERMLHRLTNSRMYNIKKELTAKQTRRWLVTLAKQLQSESKTEFLIEEMQPTWLINPRQRWIYKLIIGLIVGLTFGMIFGLMLKLRFGLVGGLTGALLGMSLGGVFAIENNYISLKEELKISMLSESRWKAEKIQQRFEEIRQNFKEERQDLRGIRQKFKEIRQDLRGIRQDLKEIRQDFEEQEQRAEEQEQALEKQEQRAEEQEQALEEQEQRAEEQEQALEEQEQKLEKVIQESVTFVQAVVLAVVLLTAGLIIGLIIGLIKGLNIGLSVGLIVIPSIVLTLTLPIMLNPISKTEITTHIRPNQGILISIKNVFTLFGTSLAVSFFAYVTLFQILNRVLTEEELSPILGLFSYLVFASSLAGGGLSCIQHFSLRLVLFFSSAIPWNYARFLNYATERMFLQRIGGRYRFIHRLLQEHFAKMEL